MYVHGMSIYIYIYMYVYIVFRSSIDVSVPCANMGLAVDVDAHV